MATLYTNIATNQQNGLNFPGGGLTTQPGSYNDPNLELADGGWICADYTITAAEVASDTIRIAKLPMGALVLPLGYIINNGAATTLTVSVGDDDPSGASTTRYSAAVSCAAAGQVIFSGGAQGQAMTGAPFFVSDECWLTATIATIGTPVAGKILRFIVPLSLSR